MDPREERPQLDRSDPISSIDPVVIGEQLALARRAHKMTQQQAADALGVARTTITAIEGGGRRPRAEELVRLAQLYNRSVSELVRTAREPQTQPIPFSLFLRTASANVDLENDPSLAEDFRTFEQFCRWYVELERAIGAPLAKRYPAPYDADGLHVDQIAEEIAVAERNRLGLGDGPLGDIYSLLETDVGVRIFAFQFSAMRVAGMFLFREDVGGCIALNAQNPDGRRRWTLIHEYFHFLTHREKAEISVLYSKKRLPPEERKADAFAKHFLMPGVGLGRRFDAMLRAKDGLPTPADVLILAHLYRVSVEAMTLRLEEIQRLPAGAWKRLQEKGFRAAQAKRYVPLSPHEPDPVLPRRYELLAAKAFEQELLTGGEFAKRLNLDRVDALARLQTITSEDQLEDGEWRQMSIDLNTALVGVGSD